MYLFIFSVLLILFQYVNSKSIHEDSSKKIETYKKKVEAYKDSILTLSDQVYDLSHFNLDRNEDAITYFEREGYEVHELIPFIKDELYKLNEVNGEHLLVPYAASSGRKMLINTVKLLNHKWIIADFSDGEFWGEIFVTYEITERRELKFKLVESFLYPFD
jgi:hypothetical protein